MHIRQLSLTNWGPYYDEHTIDLRDTVYAVQAEHEEDPDRSNWLGKSWFLGAIRFLLTGVKPESCATEDDWISRGEKLGGVVGEFSDGTTIRRTRTLGKSTQLEVTIRGQGTSKQKQAQLEIYRLIGMDHDDLMATSFVEQRQIARLVLADPAELTKIVNGWLELEPLQKAEEWLKQELVKLLARDKELSLRVTAFDVASAEVALVRTETAEEKVKALKRERSKLTEGPDLSDWHRHAERAQSFQEIKAAGIALKRQVDLIKVVDLPALEKRRDEAAAARGAARDREYQLRELVGDQWDGMCPKTCEACPAQAQVKAIGASMQIELNEAEVLLDQTDERFQSLDEALTKARQAEADRRQKTSLLEHYRGQGLALLDSVDEIEQRGAPPDDTEVREKLAILDGDLAVAERELVTALVELERIEQAQQASTMATKARKALERPIRLHQEAIAVVGRKGAQKEVAERVLGEVQTRANRLLLNAGIDLQVQVNWSREGDGLASHCDMCGASYPKNLSQKVCAICEAPRGPKVIEKLSLVPSDRSGAADDIAGLAFQLAASSWLRAKRSAAWAVACIDEPFGQLDQANSRALSTHMHAMIRSNYAFEQGFLVAHDAAVMSALPSRVQIVGSVRGSTLRVVE